MKRKIEKKIVFWQANYNILLAVVLTITGWVAISINSNFEKVGIKFVLLCFFTIVVLIIAIFFIVKIIKNKIKEL